MSEEFPYEIIEEYVRGGCSVIYKIKARDVLLSEDDPIPYVLKTMSVSDNDPQSYQRFYMEWEFLRAYPHPNLVRVKEYFKDWHGRPAYVMEWVEGETWQSYFKDKAPLEDLQNFLSISKQLCDALEFIHKHQIIHRDLKPQNVLVSKNDVVKLIDFGIMKVADLTMYTQRNTFMGSAYYVAPEGISGEPVNHTADIFALGVMLYDLFTGVKPFQGHTLGETIYQRLAKKPQAPSQLADLPEELDGIILKMLDREPRNRQQSCAQVFSELEKVFGRFVPESTLDEAPEIDVLTKGPFFHSNLLKDCRRHLRSHHLLLIHGDEGSGKSTLVENLCSREFDEVLRLDCHASTTELSFMEAILKNMRIPSNQQRELKQWMEILGAVMPGLRWTSPHAAQPISPGVVNSAFKRIIEGTTSQIVLVIEDVQDASSGLMRLILQLAGSAKELKGTTFLVFTSREPLPELEGLTIRFDLQFPDVLNLTEYLTSQFGGCQIPMELTGTLAEFAGNNLGRFVRVVQRARASGKLMVNGGQLTIVGDLSDNIENQGPVPAEIEEFTVRERNVLAWVALCPEVDVQTLCKVAGMEIALLGTLLEKASRLGLFEFQSSASDGFLWRNADAEQYLLDSLLETERISRYHTLAKTIEDQSRMFLPYSPPLWLVLCRLYQQAGDDARAAKYALDYSRHCSQTANYEPVREILSPFVSLPHFQDNPEFWSMLAMANKDENIEGALQFAKKALKIKEAPDTLALLAILEFEAGAFFQARTLIKALTKSQVSELDVQYTSQLIAILMTLGSVKHGQNLFSLLHRKLQGRNDLFATNTLLTARIRLLLPWPKRVIAELGKTNEELLPQTARQLHAWCCRAWQERFEFNKALSELGKLDEEKHSGLYFHEALFLFINFAKTVHLRNLISLFREADTERPGFKALKPLYHLATQILLNDEKAFDLEHVLKALSGIKEGRSSWLALFTTRMGFARLDEDFLAGVLDTLQVAADPFARFQIPRLRTWLELKRGEQIQPKLFLEEGAGTARNQGLITEQLRLHALHQYLTTYLGDLPELNLPDIVPLLEQSAAAQFLKTQYGRGG